MKSFNCTYTYFVTYCMRAIIIRGLYTFYSIFEGQKRLFNPHWHEL